MRTLTLTLAAAALLCSVAVNAHALERNDLLPADTTIRIHVPDMSVLVSAITNAPVAMMWKDEAFQDFDEFLRCSLFYLLHNEQISLLFYHLTLHSLLLFHISSELF